LWVVQSEFSRKSLPVPATTNNNEDVDEDEESVIS